MKKIFVILGALGLLVSACGVMHFRRTETAPLHSQVEMSRKGEMRS